MASNTGPKKINVGVLSLSRLSVVAPFLDRIKKESHDNWTFNPILIKLSAEDLDNPQYNMEIKVEAVVLLHSIMEGRFSLTDVPDARYNNLLPRLTDLFGPENVVVIAHSMPNISDVTKHVQMKVFRNKQFTTFESSRCVTICGELAGMPQDEWDMLTSFLARAPCQQKKATFDAPEKPKTEMQKSGQQKQHPYAVAGELDSTEKSNTKKSSCVSSQSRPPQADSESRRKQNPYAVTGELDSTEKSNTKKSTCVSSQSRPLQADSESRRKQNPYAVAGELDSTEKSNTKKSSCVSSQSRPLQADSESRRKQIKADEIIFVIITSEGDSDSVKVIEADIRKKTSGSITIVTPTNIGWEAAWSTADAMALLLNEKDLLDLPRKIPQEKRRKISIFRPLRKPGSAEGNKGLFGFLRSRDTTEGGEPFTEFEYEVRGDKTSSSFNTFSPKTLDAVIFWIYKCYQDRS